MEVNIVGAGVFGLSTALYLARAGYQVTVFDRYPDLDQVYNSDGASCDVNKIIRFSYGKEKSYQKLAFEGLKIWERWNYELANTTESFPKGFTRGATLFDKCGQLRISTNDQSAQNERDSLKNLREEGLGAYQYVVSDTADYKRAVRDGIVHKLDPFHRKANNKPFSATLDANGGLVNAAKACLYAIHLAKKANVKFVLGDKAGQFKEFIKRNNKVIGIVTKDGRSHYAQKTIVACGGWTPSLVPETRSILETTGGSLAFIQLPKSRPDLWTRFDSKNMPVYIWNMGDGAGVYGFPRNDEGLIKFGYRLTKYSNYTDVRVGSRISYPKTAYTEEKETNIPLQALTKFKELINDYIPELRSIGITGTKLCWYTDSFDNSFLIDYVPGYDDTLMVCTGGSGHGFKFLPVLGREVCNVIEHCETEYTRLWKWRTPCGDYKDVNGLLEGENGPRVLSKQQMATDYDWSFKSKL